MDSVSVNRFRDNLKTLVERVTTEHIPLTVTRRGAKSFVVISAEDWEQEQESLYTLQNSDLMRQIAVSLETHEKRSGYTPNAEELHEIAGL